MAMSNVRRTRPVENDSQDLFSNLGDNNITVISLDIGHVSPLCENYPYEGQTIYQGDLEYEEPSRYGHGRLIDIHFEFRSASNLFILKTEVDFKVANVIKELNSISPNQFQIYRSLTPNRENLWRFFRNADSLVEMTVLDSNGKEIEVAQLDKPISEIAGKYPIESATAIYGFQEQEIVTRYTNGSINIDSDDPKANEFIIQLFERDVIGESDG